MVCWYQDSNLRGFKLAVRVAFTFTTRPGCRIKVQSSIKWTYHIANLGEIILGYSSLKLHKESPLTMLCNLQVIKMYCELWWKRIAWARTRKNVQMECIYRDSNLRRARLRTRWPLLVPLGYAAEVTATGPMVAVSPQAIWGNVIERYMTNFINHMWNKYWNSCQNC